MTMSFAMFASYAEILAASVALLIAGLSRWEMRKAMRAKDEIVKYSRGSLSLQRSVTLKLADGKFQADEVRDLARELEAELMDLRSEQVKSLEDAKRIRALLRSARIRGERSRLIKEIGWEIADEAIRQKKTSVERVD